MARIIFAAPSCYLDASNGAAVASRAVMEAMARRRLEVEVLCNAAMDLGREVEPLGWLRAKGLEAEVEGGGAVVAGAAGVREETSRVARLSVRGVPVTMLLGRTTHAGADEREGRAFLRLFEAVAERARPPLASDALTRVLPDDLRPRADKMGLV